MLEGLKILELSHYIAGPLAGQVFADNGARVIKVEPPEGDPTRRAFPMKNGESAYFASLNSHKEFVHADLKSQSGRELVLELASDADAVICNFTHTVPAKLGIAWDDLVAVNPRLVFTQISGFGAVSDEVPRPAFDGVIQAMAGLVHLTGFKDGPPVKPGPFVADHLTGWIAASATLMAIYAAERSGHGRFVDISMFDSVFTLNHFHTSVAQDMGSAPHRAGNRSANVFSSIFPARDGWMYIAPATDGMWQKMCDVMDRPELAGEEHGYPTNDQRLAAYSVLEEIVSAWSSQRSVDELEHQLIAARVPCGAVRSTQELVESDLVRDRGMIRPVAVGDETFHVPGSPIKTVAAPAHAIRGESA